jgi:hypothetical protein
VYYDTYAIGIMNFDWQTLNELHQHQSRNNFDEKKALEFCSGKNNAFFLTTGNEPTLHADFGYTVDPKTPNTVQFTNYSCSEAYKGMSYLWDFGDGTTSKEKNPKHTYNSNSGKEYIVTLTTNLSTGSKGFLVASTQAPIIIIDDDDDPPTTASITYSEGYEGFVSFQCIVTDPEPLNLNYIKWHFDDGSNDVNGTHQITHQYSSNQFYNVTATVYYWNGNSETASKLIQVKNISGGGSGGGGGTGGGGGGGGGTGGGGGDGDCCAKSMDREVEKKGNNYTYNGEKRRVKQVIRVTNIWPFHRIAATTKNQYEKKADKWVARKVDEINVGATGTIYWGEDCKSPFSYNLWKGGETSATADPKKNASEVVMDRGTDGLSFTVGYQTLNSQHYIKDGGTVWMHRTGDPAVHDKTCK